LGRSKTFRVRNLLHFGSIHPSISGDTPWKSVTFQNIFPNAPDARKIFHCSLYTALHVPWPALSPEAQNAEFSIFPSLASSLRRRYPVLCTVEIQSST
jgi:hypothetical protein